jgi:hypothetical protein
MTVLFSKLFEKVFSRKLLTMVLGSGYFIEQGEPNDVLVLLVVYIAAQGLHDAFGQVAHLLAMKLQAINPALHRAATVPSNDAVRTGTLDEDDIVDTGAVKPGSQIMTDSNFKL